MDDFDPAYIRYIKSEAWKLRCAAYFMRYGRWCKACGTRKGPLQVHHMTYDRLGKEPLTDLVSVCAPCHRGIHALHRKRGRRISLYEATQTYIKTKNTRR
jgi:predicted HNH restriction endonuclease